MGQGAAVSSPPYESCGSCGPYEAERDQETAGRLISHWQAQRLPYNSA